MKRLWIYLILLSILTFGPQTALALDIPTLTTFQPPPGPAVIRLDINSNGQTIALRVQDEIDISLEENYTTGYSWHFDRPLTDQAFFEFLSEERLGIEAFRGGVGSPVMHIFKLRSVKAGNYTITLKYFRIWEGSDTAIRQFQITTTANVTE